MPDQLFPGDALAPSPPGRAVSDAPAARQAIYDRALHAARNIPPLENNLYSIGIKDVGYADPEHYSKAKRKHAVLTGDTLARRLRGTIEMTDKVTGQVVDSRKLTLGSVPHMNDDGTFVLNGSEMTLGSQPRLRPGIFTRWKESGELESHFNVSKGLGHRVLLEPDTGVFRMSIGQAKIPLLPILQGLGATREQLQTAWGPEIYQANQKAHEERSLDKLAEKLLRKPEGTPEERRKLALEHLAAMTLDPEVTSRTLGRPYENLGADTYLAATQKLLGVSRGEMEPDDRDHLAYMRMMGPEDLIAERIEKAHRALHPLLWRATNRKNLDSFLPGFLDKHIRSALQSSGLGQNLEEVGPLEILGQLNRVTRMGRGGIGSTSSIPDSSRSVQTSHLGFLDPVQTPEAETAGVDLRAAGRLRKDEHGKSWSPFRNPKTGKEVWVTPQDLAEKSVAFPGELELGKPYVRGIQNGQLQYIPRDQIDYVAPPMEESFGHLANLVPLKSASKGQRVMMGARMSSQAMSLTNPEAPHVQTGVPGSQNESYHEQYGRHLGAMHVEEQGGTVLRVTPDEITVKQQDGTRRTYELHNQHPYNRKSVLHQTAVVRSGDQVKPGQLLAHSNFTDAKGVAAFGRNVRAAYLPFHGESVEDAIVAAESARPLFTSIHGYQHDMDWSDPKLKRGKGTYVSLFPSKFNRHQLDRLDDDGVIKPGTEVHYGDPILLGAREKELGHHQISRKGGAGHSDAAVIWEHEAPGIVTDAVKTDKGATAFVRSEHQLQVGDKLSGLYGNKGVVSRFVADDQMPKAADGRPIHLLLNSLGLTSRVNPSQIHEALLGKVADKTGAPYKLQDFHRVEDLAEFVAEELRKHGLKGHEDLIDPTTGARIPDVTVGNPYILKLHHTSSSKSKGRSIGGYDAEQLPSRGGDTGSKRSALMHTTSLLSHGGSDILKGIFQVRGQENAEMWSRFMAGQNPGEPRVPLVNQKFFAMLQAAGLNPIRRGEGKLQAIPMTRQHVSELTEGRELSHADMVDWKGGLKPLPGGLFDPAKTGGHSGKKWSELALHEPMLSPIMEEPALKLLGLTSKKFQEVLAGHEQLQGETGPGAIAKALDHIDLDKEIAKARTDIKSGRATARDVAIKKLRYLKGAQEAGVHPRDWVLDKIPVLPPIFRPVNIMRDTGLPLVADANLLYRDLHEANQNLKHLSGQVEDVGTERQAVYAGMKALAGLGDPIGVKNKERGVRGLLDTVLGSSPKHSHVQQKLLGRAVDSVGRAAITPDADYGMDQIGIPENGAWEVYRPFVVRRLVRHGTSPIDALRQVKDQTPLARKALEAELEARPVLMDRAPVLHRYGIMAYKPHLVPGDSVVVNPYVLKAHGADFDGDQQFDHVFCRISVSALTLLGQTATVEGSSHLEDQAVSYGADTTLFANNEHETFLVHLSDFPHLALEKTTQGKHGQIDWYRIPAGVEVLAYDEQAQRLLWKPASHWSKHHGCAVQIVDLDSGRQIYTDDDQRAVYGVLPGTLELGRRRPAESTGMMVPRMQRMPEPVINFTEIKTAQWRTFGGTGSNGPHTHRLIDLLVLDADVGYFLGAEAGDGWATLVNNLPMSFALAGITEEIAEKMDKVVAGFFVGAGPQRGSRNSDDSYGESRKHVYASAELGRMVYSLLGHGADFKHLPPWFLRTSREFRLGLFAGLMDTDGSISISHAKKKPQLMANYSSNSLRLIQEVLLLAASLGIRGRVTPSKTPAGRDHWIVSFSNGDIKRWAGAHMVHPCKLAKLEEGEVKESGIAARYDLLPISRSLATAIRRSFGVTGKKETYKWSLSGTYSAVVIAAKTGIISRQTAKRLPEMMNLDTGRMHKEWDRWWKIVEDETVTWDRVVGFQDTGIKVDGYDLTVPGSETFTSATGVVLSNTVNYHVPFSDAEVKESLERLLPSKNLLAVKNFQAHLLPINEFKGGLYLASAQVDRKKAERVFHTIQDVLDAHRRGEISHDTRVMVGR